MTAEEKAPFETWAVLELMGHVRLAGRVTEESLFGTALGRIDIPTGGDDEFVTQYFGGGSIYRMTPVSEEAARQVARSARPQPIYRLELTTAPAHHHQDLDEDGEPY